MGRFGRRPSDAATRTVAGAVLLVALPYGAWRLGWSHRGADLPVWVLLLLAELVVLSRLVLEAVVLLRRPPADPPPLRLPLSVDLAVVVDEEPLLLVRMCVRSCRSVAGVRAVWVIDRRDRDDVAGLCARVGVERLPAGGVEGAGEAYARFLAASTSPVVGLVPASVVVQPNLVAKAGAAFGGADVGAVAVAAAARGPRGLVGGGGYPLESDDGLRLARGLDAGGGALPLHGPVLFRTGAVRALGGFASTSRRPALATCVELGAAGLRTRVEAEALALRAAPWDEDDALRERAGLAGSRLATVRRLRGIGAGGRPSAARALAALELWAPVARLATLALMVIVPVTGGLPVSLAGRGPAVAAVFWGMVAVAGRVLGAPGEPFGARLRRGLRTLSVVLWALAGRVEAPPPGVAVRQQAVVVAGLLACCVVAGVAPVVGPAAGRLPEEAHGVLLVCALALAWLARDAHLAVEDRQRRSLPRAEVLAAPPGRSHGVEVRRLSPQGVELVDRGAGCSAGDVVLVDVRLPRGGRSAWERTLEAVVVRVGPDGSAFARFDLDDDAADELLHYCAVTVPLAARSGVVAAPVLGTRPAGRRRDPATAGPVGVPGVGVAARPVDGRSFDWLELPLASGR